MATRPPTAVDEWEDVGGDEWEDVSAGPAAVPATESGYTHPMARFGAGAVRGVAQAFNPIEIARSLKAMAALGYKGLTAPTTAAGELVGIPKAITQRAMESPEGLGETVGGFAAGAVPVGGAAAGLARRMGMNPASRAHSITRALRASERQIPALEKAAAEIELPVTASHRRLAAELAARKATAGEAVGAAEAALPETPVSTTDIVGRMEPPAGQWVDRGGTLEFVPDDPQAFAAFQSSVSRLESAGPLTAQDALRIKRAEQAIAERGKAYERTLPGEEATVSAGVARAKGKAIRQTLEALPGPESEALTAANRTHYLASIAEKPAARELLRIKKQPFAQRGAEILLGRAGAGSRTSVGALAGLFGGQLLDSTLFHTAGAAIKKRVIDALESGNPQAAADILFRSAITESQRRRAAAAELAAQGEGVTVP